MQLVSNIAVLLIAVLHLYILVLEMFLWTKPYGRRAFGLTKERAEMTATLAANQGLYNGFLAAGLLWGLYLGEAGYSIQIFFPLLCHCGGYLRCVYGQTIHPMDPGYSCSRGAGPCVMVACLIGPVMNHVPGWGSRHF